MTKLEKFVERQTIHGLKELLDIKSKFLKILWGSALLFCIIIMIFEMYRVTVMYYEAPTATHVNKVYQGEYDYPAILFCPTKWINQTKVIELNFSRPSLMYGLSFLSYSINTDYNSSIPVVEAKKEFYSKLGNQSLIDFFYSISVDSDKILNCDTCFVPPVKKWTVVGVCYDIKFRTKSSMLIQWEQPTLQYDESNADLMDLEYATDFGTVGAMTIGSHENNTVLINPILITANITWIIKIKISLYERISTKSRKCHDPKIMPQRFYSNAMCMSDCEENTFSPCWGCNYLGYFITDKSHGKIPHCDLIVQPSSDADALCNKETDPTFVECMKNCYIDCREYIYSTNFVKMNNKHFANYLKKNLSESIIIKFDLDTRYGVTFYREMPMYTWDRYVSDIGGLLGLWLGGSIISLFQIFYWSLNAVYENAKKGNEGKEKPSINEK